VLRIVDSLAKFWRHLAGPQDIGAAYGDIQKVAIERNVKISYNRYRPLVWK